MACSRRAPVGTLAEDEPADARPVDGDDGSAASRRSSRPFWGCSRAAVTSSSAPGPEAEVRSYLGDRASGLGGGPVGGTTWIRSAPASPSNRRATSADTAMVASARAGSRPSSQRSGRAPTVRPTSSSTRLWTLTTSGGRAGTRDATQPAFRPWACTRSCPATTAPSARRLRPRRPEIDAAGNGYDMVEVVEHALRAGRRRPPTRRRAASRQVRRRGAGSRPSTDRGPGAPGRS